MNTEQDFDPPRRESSALERHAQTLVTAVILAVLLWIGSAVVDVRDRLSRYEERNVTQSAQLNQILADRMTASQWLREREVLVERLDRLERALERHEGREARGEVPERGRSPVR